MLDLRNHGMSHGFRPPHTMDACVGDLVVSGNLAARSPTALIGHSLGGKVLLQLARSPDALTRLTQFPVNSRGTKSDARALQIFVVDSFPGALRHSRRNTADEVDGVFEVLDFVAHTPAIIPSKQWLLDSCKARGISVGVAQWLAMSLTQLPSHPRHKSTIGARTAEVGRVSDGFHWVFDPVAAQAMFESHNVTDCWDVLLKGPPAGVDIHLIMASKSTRWHDAETKELLAEAARAQADFRNGSALAKAGRGNVYQHTLEAGHWIHTDNPSALVDVITSGISASQ